jgi:hypothetical protein
MERVELAHVGTKLEALVNASSGYIMGGELREKLRDYRFLRKTLFHEVTL